MNPQFSLKNSLSQQRSVSDMLLAVCLVINRLQRQRRPAILIECHLINPINSRHFRLRS